MAQRTMQPNDILWDDLYERDSEGYIVKKQNYPDLAFRMFCRVFKYKGFAIKEHCQEREIELTKLAGDCSVKVYGHVVRFDSGPDRKQPREVGLVMELARPLPEYARQADGSGKHRIKAEMIALVERLHTQYNMVHGDIKPDNFLVCEDNKIKLCDFEGGRLVDESVEIWESLEPLALNGRYTPQYMNKTRDTFVPPTKDDDWYALAISIWEIYTDKDAFEGIYEEEDLVLLHSTGQTVDLNEVKDVETREWIRGILRKGGASV
ncbi:hypothetical protein TWF718_009647 [Orbilia javanica]|uniref:Protein kinase domain-containing protein n=1 Tax=Orbilia javanica TaxID=47235 RepID=A0AAN8MQ52_9PEZI